MMLQLTRRCDKNRSVLFFYPILCLPLRIEKIKTTMRNEIIQLIFKIAKEKDAFDQLEKHLSTITKQQLSSHLIECGILPEMFEHDSSEEKLWAKFSDILLAKALTFLDIEAHVLGARGNSADVFGKNDYYTIVGDAKTFRLSRTAKTKKILKSMH
jgi:HindIII restriction endonuclease